MLATAGRILATAKRVSNTHSLFFSLSFINDNRKNIKQKALFLRTGFSKQMRRTECEGRTRRSHKNKEPQSFQIGVP